MQGACRAMAALDNLASVYMQSGNWVSCAAVGAGAVELALVDTGLVIQRVAAASAEPGLIQRGQGCCAAAGPFGHSLFVGNKGGVGFFCDCTHLKQTDCFYLREGTPIPAWQPVHPLQVPGQHPAPALHPAGRRASSISLGSRRCPRTGPVPAGMLSLARIPRCHHAGMSPAGRPLPSQVCHPQPAMAIAVTGPWGQIPCLQ